MVWIFLFLAFLGILAIGCFIYLVQDRMIFFPARLSPKQVEVIKKIFPDAEIRIETSDKKILHGWLLRREKGGRGPLVIYYGGNAEEVSNNLLDPALPKDFHFLFMNYRGYGLSEGQPSQKALYADALKIFDQMVQYPGVHPEEIYLMGRSLGAAVAVYVASERPVKGLILVTPWDSLGRVAQRHYPYLPISLLLKHPFDSLSLAKKLEVPLLGLVAAKDSIIPPSHARNFMNHYRGPKTTVVIEGAEHNDVQDFPEYWRSIHQFLNNN